jgi:hypothetical protein
LLSKVPEAADRPARLWAGKWPGGPSDWMNGEVKRGGAGAAGATEIVMTWDPGS